MSDCSANAWRVPVEREPGVLYDHGQPNYDYLQARAIVIGGVRFERVRECEFMPFKDEDWSEPNAVRGVCSECSAIMYGKDRYCPNCGKTVKR